MYGVRESHNDVTFIDEFLTDEFVRERNYFTYEYSQACEGYRVASVDAEDVKRKLLLQFTNFGKPTVVVLDEAVRRAQRRGSEPDGEEVGVLFQYDGGEVTEHDLGSEVKERIVADEVDYDTKPDDWLA